jgi:methyltransferase (TIGR00027 family)
MELILKRAIIPPRRIETKASRTADFTCACRALSWMETNPYFKSEDWVAPRLLPTRIQWLIKFPLLRKVLSRIVTPKGVYAWVIARTKYIDDWFTGISREGFTQVLILGAGFDSRSVRFADELCGMRIFELDSGTTQIMKTSQFNERQVDFPENVTFIPVNFELEDLSPKLGKAGFRKDAKTLLLMEGVLQYLKPEAVCKTLEALQKWTAPGSRLICDFANSSFFNEEENSYGKSALLRSLQRYGETFRFGLSDDKVEPFFAGYGFNVIEKVNPADLEEMYFKDRAGRLHARVNGVQTIITAERI